jgi:hypothetical protein
MFTRSPFHPRQFTRARLVVLCAVLLIAALAVFNPGAPRSHASDKRQSLSFADRVAAQRAIEAVYHRQRIWPTDNPQPKPALDEVLPEAALRAKVEEYLRMSRALEVFTGAALTPEQLQAELERMARQTRQPEVLGALWAALDHDPLLVAECLARPVVAERELRRWYEQRDEGGRMSGKDEGGGMKDEASLSALHPSSLIPHPSSFILSMNGGAGCGARWTWRWTRRGGRIGCRRLRRWLCRAGVMSGRLQARPVRPSPAHDIGTLLFGLEVK